MWFCLWQVTAGANKFLGLHSKIQPALCKRSIKNIYLPTTEQYCEMKVIKIIYTWLSQLICWRTYVWLGLVH